MIRSFIDFNSKDDKVLLEFVLKKFALIILRLS